MSRRRLRGHFAGDDLVKPLGRRIGIPIGKLFRGGSGRETTGA